MEEEDPEALLGFFRENADVTAVFAANAGMGLKAMDALEAAGRRALPFCFRTIMIEMTTHVHRDKNT